MELIMTGSLSSELLQRYCFDEARRLVKANPSLNTPHLLWRAATRALGCETLDLPPTHWWKQVQFNPSPLEKRRKGKDDDDIVFNTIVNVEIGTPYEEAIRRTAAVLQVRPSCVRHCLDAEEEAFVRRAISPTLWTPELLEECRQVEAYLTRELGPSLIGPYPLYNEVARRVLPGRALEIRLMCEFRFLI